MDLKETFKLLLTLLVLSLLFLLCSCAGSRKTQKSNVTELSKSEQTAKVNTDIEKKTETKTVVNNESNEIEITPIDTAKVLIINGKIYKNAKVKILNRKSQLAIIKNETVKDKTKSENKAVTATKKQTKVKDTEKKSNPFTPLLWFGLGVVIYLAVRFKYKLFRL